MKNLVLSHVEYSGYAEMTILPPNFSISVDFRKGEDFEDKDRISCCISFADKFHILKRISLFPIDSDVEFINFIYPDRSKTEKIRNSVLNCVIYDIAAYIHKLKQTDSEGDIVNEVTFPLHEYMKDWQERFNTSICSTRYIMNYNPNKE